MVIAYEPIKALGFNPVDDSSKKLLGNEDPRLKDLVCGEFHLVIVAVHIAVMWTSFQGM